MVYLHFVLLILWFLFISVICPSVIITNTKYSFDLLVAISITFPIIDAKFVGWDNIYFSSSVILPIIETTWNYFHYYSKLSITFPFMIDATVLTYWDHDEMAENYEYDKIVPKFWPRPPDHYNVWYFITSCNLPPSSKYGIHIQIHLWSPELSQLPKMTNELLVLLMMMHIYGGIINESTNDGHYAWCHHNDNSNENHKIKFQQICV